MVLVMNLAILTKKGTREMSDIRKQIQEQMSKIPDAVKNGSVQQVIRWKERCNEAQRIVNNSKATQHQLEQALRSLK
jgi:hypothetical protein